MLPAEKQCAKAIAALGAAIVAIRRLLPACREEFRVNSVLVLNTDCDELTDLISVHKRKRGSRR
jgi:hypothetical protein